MSQQPWQMTAPPKKLIAIGAKGVRHSPHVIFQMAKMVVPRELLARILEPI